MSKPTTPVEPGEPHVDAPAGAAGGVGAVAATLRVLRDGPGLWRGASALLQVNQEDGFDCPSCAWPDPETRATAEFCENGAKAVADEATGKRVSAGFFAEHSIAELATRSDHWLNAQGRLAEPMWRPPGASHYQPIAWEAAFARVADALGGLASPDEAVFYTSGRTSNEAAFLYQLFVRAFGTNNLPDCSNMCHESSGVGLMAQLGTGKGTVSLDDFAHADLILLCGQNPGTNHPRMLTTLREAHRRGARIIAINPLREAGLLRFRHPQHAGDFLGGGVPISDLLLQVRVGGDVALCTALAQLVLAEDRARPGGVLDREFIARHTTGFAEWAAFVEAQPLAELLAEAGVSEAAVRQAASLLAGSERTIACWAMGLTQHENGVANVQALVNLLLLGGHLGRQGAGACPVRGHSNVQGDRTMGVWEQAPSWIEALERAVPGLSAPRRIGLDTVGAIAAMRDGQAHVFFGLGGNFLSATPDTEVTAAALARCRLTAHVSTKLNRAHLVTGAEALILPCLGRSERDEVDGVAQLVTVEDSMSVVHTSRGTLTPASPSLRSETAIVAGIAAATLGARPVDWAWLAADHDRIRDLVARVIPGFADFNRRVREPGGFTLVNPASQRVFPTASERAHFVAHAPPRRQLAPGRFLMTTIRSHDQFNTTIYALDDRYRGVYGHRRVVLAHPDDLAGLGLAPGQKVTLVSHHAGQERRARDFVVCAYDIPRGNLATYFPEANTLVPLEQFAAGSRTPASKSVEVSLEAQA